MKLFDARDCSSVHDYADIMHAASEHAQGGGQALHVWSPPRDAVGRACWPGAPEVFERSGGPWAHLFDQDVDRLRSTARRLGVRMIKVEYLGRTNQHVDLCGAPLRRAMQEADHGGSDGHQDTDRLFVDPPA